MPMTLDRISTSHAGSLPRTAELITANAARTFAEDGFTLERTPEFDALLTTAVVDLVQRQKNLGITIPGDGEYGKAMSNAVDYGAWWTYSFQRTSGLELTDFNPITAEPIRSGPGDIRLTSFADRRDWTQFAAAYSDPESGIQLGRNATAFPTATGPISYIGRDALNSDIANLKAGLAAADLPTGFITSLSPGSASRIGNEYYRSEEEFIYAWADVLREEYKAIVDAGLIVQIDDPSVAENWDQINPEPSVEDYQRFTRIRVDALNHALRGLPEEQVRFHVCWGSWHGPHTTDIGFEHIVDLVLGINAGSYSFEAGNVRHEHEWTIWQDRQLPDGKVLVPGVVSHATNVVEHPELVAQRIERFASLVGRENVIAGTDCGLGGRLHPDIAVAKLESLGRGAEIATNRLFHGAAAAH
ncbi:cobalamin-independent methionine synthase II family protein [Arthrobacter sp. zg-Y820]|uniref:cobalamin-independent methionine synthase II family protein n=2 Tax=Arthrobacter TaxID=1663 RepID=UPI002541767A|nr:MULTISPECIES: cobalamin-independent methionine synthase II family protein [unclassified Arthrobacter]MCC9196859.1 cobalamin-independent methionine synthase II family protein [Arthrobacter sp. zg-Y820]MDK1279721.1 cobalamin-independent methionine synthase II family protein [Arthrobacter sp. zg.Y820]WIB11124.1 cobalamin-independent methionine synthase II family protein [Arthrobacter sp. zg-Y820]